MSAAAVPEGTAASAARAWLVTDALVDAPTEGTAVIAHLLAEGVAGGGGVVVSAAARPAVAGSLPWLGTGPVPLRLLGALLASRRRAASLTYLPLGGLSWTVLLRAVLMALCGRRAVTLLMLQRYSEPPRWLVRPCRALVHVAAANEDDRLAAERLGLRAQAWSPPQDESRVGREDRRAARERLGLPLDRPVVLHVGHGTPGRGLLDLAPLAEHAEVVLVLSPGTPLHPGALPTGPGVRVVHERVDVAAYYRAADLYLFPTVDRGAVIGVPLSIGEALLNETPVVARRGPLTERWEGDPAVHLVDSAAALVERSLALLTTAGGGR